MDYIKPGSHVVRPGTSRSRTSTANSGMRNGIVAFAIRLVDKPLKRCRINKTIPKGGVNNPIIMVRTMITPNCMGSMPTEMATGSKVDARIVIAAVASRKQPTINKKTMISSPMTMGFVERVIRDAARFVAILDFVTIYPNT